MSTWVTVRYGSPQGEKLAEWEVEADMRIPEVDDILPLHIGGEEKRYKVTECSHPYLTQVEGRVTTTTHTIAVTDA